MGKIYTRTGDAGQTAMIGGKRVSKSDPRLAAYGEVDELNSMLGLCGSLLEADPGLDAGLVLEVLARVQAELFRVGAALATPEEVRDQYALPPLEPQALSSLEEAIDRLEAKLPKLRNFILPGGHPAAAQLHVARTVCRRAERGLVAVRNDTAEDRFSLQYLNRLSDYLFTAARWVNHRSGRTEKIWKG